MKPLVSMRAALNDPDLFAGVLVGDSWAGWRVLLIASLGEALTNSERIIFEQLTQREREPLSVIEELIAIIGRRSGKTRAAAILAVFIAALCDHGDKLAPGERGLLPILSASVWQAQRAFGYLSGIFSHVAALKALVVTETADTISLSNGIDIECRPASFRTIRDATCVAIICDEVAFWRNENSQNPDKEILDACRPALATTGGPLVCISSPYGKRGEIWNAFRRDYSPEGDPRILVAKGSSRQLNPTLPQKVVDRAMERDPQSAKAEFGGEFRNDISGFLDFALVDAAVDYGVTVRPPVPGVRYRAACDPSGGARDSFTLAVAHDEGEVSVLDTLIEVKAPFNPTSAVETMAATLKEYRLSNVTGDRYAAGWVPDAFKKVGVSYLQSDCDRSAAYLDALPLFTAGRVRLLDNPRLVSQFVGLERRTSAVGKDRVDHGPSGHDDLCNSVALALVSRRRGYDSTLSWVGTDEQFAGAQNSIFAHDFSGQGGRRWYG